MFPYVLVLTCIIDPRPKTLARKKKSLFEKFLSKRVIFLWIEQTCPARGPHFSPDFLVPFWLVVRPRLPGRAWTHSRGQVFYGLQLLSPRALRIAHAHRAPKLPVTFYLASRAPRARPGCSKKQSPRAAQRQCRGFCCFWASRARRRLFPAGRGSKLRAAEKWFQLYPPLAGSAVKGHRQLSRAS